MEINLGPERCSFASYTDWVNHANTRLGGIPYHQRADTVCVDSAGRICRIGRDFIQARKDKTYPVVAYTLRQDVE